MLTQDKISAFHTDLDAAIEAVAKKHGMTFKQVGRMMYDPTVGTVKYNTMFGDVATMGGDIDPVALKVTRTHGWFNSFKVEDIGKLEFTYGGKKYLFMGLKNRDTAIIKEVATGKPYRLKSAAVALAAGRKSELREAQTIVAGQVADLRKTLGI